MIRMISEKRRNVWTFAGILVFRNKRGNPRQIEFAEEGGGMMRERDDMTLVLHHPRFVLPEKTALLHKTFL